MLKQKFMALVLFLALNLSLTSVWADNNYSDVLAGQWYTDGVNFAIDDQLFKLDSDREFGLNHPVSRSEMVYALWVLYRQPQAESSREFSDLSTDAYYYEAIQWAASVGITSGMGNGQFGVNQLLTREQAVTFLENMNIYLKCDLNEDINISFYTDFDQISEYAIGPFQWACGEGIITGTSPSTLSPKGSLTRSQLSVMLMKFYSTRDSGENTFGFDAEPALIQLEGNATTGFGWYVDKSNEDLYMVEELNYLTSEPNLPGSGGIFQFQVTGLKPGNGILSFLYYRSWEGEAIDKAVYQINVADNGTVTATKLENTFGFDTEPALIQLEGNASTGFGWYVDKSNEEIYTVEELDYLTSEPNLPGSGGIFQFQVTGLKPGSDTLSFLYYRPWEGEAIDKAVYQINVAYNGAVTATKLENTFGFDAEPAIIQLKGNASTGFGWYITKSDEDLYIVNELDYVPNFEGSSGIFQFQVTGLKPGVGELCFAYYRPWEEQKPDNQQVTFQITIDSNGKVTANQI